MRLRGRGETAVWGHLVFTSETGVERLEDFHFDLQTYQLTLKKPTGDQTLQLDEMGVVTVDS